MESTVAFRDDPTPFRATSSLLSRATTPPLQPLPASSSNHSSASPPTPIAPNPPVTPPGRNPASPSLSDSGPATTADKMRLEAALAVARALDDVFRILSLDMAACARLAHVQTQYFVRTPPGNPTHRMLPKVIGLPSHGQVMPRPDLHIMDDDLKILVELFKKHRVRANVGSSGGGEAQTRVLQLAWPFEKEASRDGWVWDFMWRPSPFPRASGGENRQEETDSENLPSAPSPPARIQPPFSPGHCEAGQNPPLDQNKAPGLDPVLTDVPWTHQELDKFLLWRLHKDLAQAVASALRMLCCHLTVELRKAAQTGLTVARFDFEPFPTEAMNFLPRFFEKKPSSRILHVLAEDRQTLQLWLTTSNLVAKLKSSSIPSITIQWPLADRRTYDLVVRYRIYRLCGAVLTPLEKPNQDSNGADSVVAAPAGQPPAPTRMGSMPTPAPADAVPSLSPNAAPPAPILPEVPSSQKVPHTEDDLRGVVDTGDRLRGETVEHLCRALVLSWQNLCDDIKAAASNGNTKARYEVAIIPGQADSPQLCHVTDLGTSNKDSKWRGKIHISAADLPILLQLLALERFQVKNKRSYLSIRW